MASEQSTVKLVRHRNDQPCNDEESQTLLHRGRSDHIRTRPCFVYHMYIAAVVAVVLICYKLSQTAHLTIGGPTEPPTAQHTAQHTTGRPSESLAAHRTVTPTPTGRPTDTPTAQPNPAPPIPVDCFLSGHWVQKDTWEQLPYAPLGRGKKCYNVTNTTFVQHKLGSQHFEWENSCMPAKWTLPDDFSPALWVGDSLMGQFVRSFNANMHVDASAVVYKQAMILVNPYTLRPMTPNEIDDCREMPLKYTKTPTSPPCPPSLKEDIVPTSKGNYHQQLKYQSWTKTLESREFNTLLLQTGHHWHKESRTISDGFKPESTAWDKYESMVRGVVTYLRSTNFTGRIVYVTSPPGHANCNSHTTPSPIGRNENVYAWNKPNQYEHLWQTVMEDVLPEVTFTILNITHLSLERADGHPMDDCLHWCTPGVPDTWTQYLLKRLNE